MKLVSYNIRFGLGTDQRIDLGRIADAVRNADIIALQEVERNWVHSGMIDQPEVLGGHLREFYWVYFPAFDMDASERDADGSVRQRRRQFGPMVMSRWPIRSSRMLALPKLGTVGGFNMDTGALECIVETPSGPLRVYSLHLSALSSRERLLQIDHLLAFHRSAYASGGAWTGNFRYPLAADNQSFSDLDWSNGEPMPPMPLEAIVMGDFNSEPSSTEYERMVNSLDAGYLRLGNFDSFVDSWAVARERGDEAMTWWPDPPGRSPGHPTRLDYCFVGPSMGDKIARAWVDVDALGSDHRPYWIEMDQ